MKTIDLILDPPGRGTRIGVDDAFRLSKHLWEAATEMLGSEPNVVRQQRGRGVYYFNITTVVEEPSTGMVRLELELRPGVRKPKQARRRALARAHVAMNLIALINLAMDGRDGGWAHRYAPAELDDEPELQETAAADIQATLDEVRTMLERWLPGKGA